MTPEDRRYVRTHEWVKLEGNTAVVGITDHAQEALGDITFIELPELGEPVEEGHECAVIESVKAASDLYAPVSGTISAVNAELATTPELVNEDCYERGWIFKISGVAADALEDMMDAPEYEATLDDD
jgi:glycine cleavage system H protein